MRIKAAAAHATFKILCPAPPAGGACCHFHLEVSIYSTSQLYCPISTHHPCTNINKQDLKWTHWTQPSGKILKGLMIKKLPLSSCNVLRIETTNGQDWWGSQANTSYTKCGLHLIENLNQKSMTLLTSLHLMRHQTNLRPDVNLESIISTRILEKIYVDHRFSVVTNAFPPSSNLLEIKKLGYNWLSCTFIFLIVLIA